MKIWSINTIVDGSAEAEVVFTEAEADAREETHYRALWAEVMGGREYPGDAASAHGILCGEDVRDDQLMWVTLHDISGHPDLQPDPYQTSAEANAYRMAVPGQNDELTVNADAIVLPGDDDGAFVQAWVWVTDEAAGILPDACEDCGNTLNDGSDICDQCGGNFAAQQG